jgi:transposase
MAHQFKPVDRDSAMLLPRNMLDWVPEGHAVRVVISTAGRLATRDLIDRLVPSAPAGSAAGPARYDPVMLLAVWMYACLRGVLSTRAVEDRCRYDATFRVACGRQVPDHTTFSRFRRHLLAREHLAEDLFCQVLHVCACAGLGRLGVVAGDGVKIAANASKEASRTEAGLRKLAAQVMDGARKAAAGDEALEPPLPGTDLLPGADMAPGPDPRSRAGRIAACLGELQGEREAAGAHAREQGKACLEALAAGTAAAGRPPAAVALAAGRLRLEMAIAAGQAVLADWQARRAAGQRAAARPPARPGTGKKARRARARLEGLQAAAAAEAEKEAAGAGQDKPAQPRRNVTDPDSRLMPVRGGGFIQGYNCQDAAADDRLMPGGYACQDTGDVLQARRLAQVAARGAAVVAAAHAAHAGDPAALRACHDRMCTLPEQARRDPGHDAACHHAMTSAIGVLAEDAGYHSEANLTAPGPGRLIADARTRDLARRKPAEGPPPENATAVEASAHRLATPQGRAAYKRRAPDVEGLHASLKDQGGLRRFSLRGLHNATSEFLLAGLAHNLRLLAAIS